MGQKCCGSGTSAVAEAGISGQAHRVTIARNHDTRPVTRLASLLITALAEDPQRRRMSPTQSRPYDHLIGLWVPAARIVAYGESLGSGQAVKLAAARPVAAVVLEAPLTSTIEVARSASFLGQGASHGFREGSILRAETTRRSFII